MPRKSSLTDAQIVQILREAETHSLSVSEICRQYNISTSAFYRWKARFGSMNQDEVRKLKLMESENARLKKLLAERDLEIEVLKEINAKKW